MTSRWRELALSAAVCLSTSHHARAQQVFELGLQSIGTLSDPALIVGGGYGAWRASGRTRFSAGIAGGAAGGDFAWRGEALAHFLLSPEERRKPGFYVAGGIAGTGAEATRGYLVLTLGVEQRPGTRSGWALEAGVGGGVRVAAGYRWRWHPQQGER
jgi:hypothetical protein